MNNKELKAVGKPWLFVQEHFSSLERRIGHKLPDSYVQLLRKYGQAEFMDASGSHGVLFFPPLYALWRNYLGDLKLAKQMGDPDPLSIGLFPFASNASGGLYWDLRKKSGNDYCVVSNPLILKNGYETEQSWNSTQALIDSVVNSIDAPSVIVRMLPESTTRSQMDGLVSEFLKDML